jgi:hypothetical protein
MNSIVNKLKIGFADRQYETLIFIVLMMELVIYIPSPIQFLGTEKTISVSGYYMLSYDLGFVSRAFVGTIAQTLHGILYGGGGKYISNEFIWCFIVCFAISINIITSLLLSKVIKQFDENVRTFVIGFVVLYLASPFCVSYLFTRAYITYLDYFIILCIILSIIVIQYKKLCWFLPLICCCIIATHLVSLFYFIPIISIVLIYEYIKNKTFKFIVLLIMAMSTYFSLFFYFIFFSKSNLKYNTLEQILSHLPNIRDEGSMTLILNAEYFFTLYETFAFHILPQVSWLFSYLLSSIILLSPLIVIISFVWIFAIRNENNNKMKLLFLSSSILPIIYAIPCFILFCDWPRWFGFIFTNQFLLIFYYLYSKEKSIIYAIQKIGNFAKNHIFVSLMTIVYLLILGRNPIFTSRIIEPIKYVFYKLISI